MNWSETINLLSNHEPVTEALFVVMGAVIFYATLFFMEIALAKLADTGRVRDAFNCCQLKES